MKTHPIYRKAAGMTRRQAAPSDADATDAYRRCVRKGRKYGLLLAKDAARRAMIATPHAQRRASIRDAVLDHCGMTRAEASSDEAANAVYAEIMAEAQEHALITSAYAGNASIATPATQRRKGIRGRVLAAHRMTEARGVAT